MDESPQPQQALHVTDEQVGGSEQLVQIRKRKPHARPTERELVLELVTDPLAHVDVVLSRVVPATRAECPKTRPCGHYRCEWFLSRADGETRAGRRHGGRPPPTTLRFVSGAPTNCGLDLTDRPHTTHELEAVLGLDHRRIEQLVHEALVKLRDSGVNVEDFLSLTSVEGHERVPVTERLDVATPVSRYKTKAR